MEKSLIREKLMVFEGRSGLIGMVKIPILNGKMLAEEMFSLKIDIFRQDEASS
jgi:hypothetical protein